MRLINLKKACCCTLVFVLVMLSACESQNIDEIDQIAEAQKRNNRTAGGTDGGGISYR